MKPTIPGGSKRGQRRALLAPSVLVALALVAGWRHVARGDWSADIPFEKHTLDLGRNETCAVADVNRDGRLDIVSGENWYEGAPAAAGGGARGWVKHKIRTLNYAEYYIDNFSDLPMDVNGDGYPDVVSCSWFSETLGWWENSGAGSGPWREHAIQKGSPVEFSFLVDIRNAGKAMDILPQFGDSKMPLAWYELTGTGADAQWVKHQVSTQSYGHGIGAGDVNADGRTDIITPKGWFEAPADPRQGAWTFHPEFDLGVTGFIHTEDLNRDGRADLVTSAAHDFGIFWYEQKKDAQGKRAWEKHVIDSSWSQAHALTLVDLNGDGRLDFVTGKRYMAHNGGDPGEREPLGVYWYEAVNVKDRLEWVRHIIDFSTRAGGGMQIPVVDLDGDSDLDIVVAGKSGLFLFENLSR